MSQFPDGAGAPHPSSRELAVLGSYVLMLRDKLGHYGLAPGVTMTRVHVMLTLPGGMTAWCCGASVLWPSGRVSVGGRPLATLHSLYDPVGAARRLAHSHKRHGGRRHG